MINDTCPACDADLILDGVIEVLRDPTSGAGYLTLSPCCEYAEEAGLEAVLGCTYAEACIELGCAADVQRVDGGQLVERGREVDAADVDGLIVERLTVEVVTGGQAQREVAAAVDAHHRHHGPSRGWHFGVVARRGPVVVGVAVCGRPVSRHLQAQGYVEVTRCCTWGDRRLSRDVASALYRAAAREYQRRGCRWTTEKGRTTDVRALVTYTLAHESGASLRAAGFACEGEAGGGAWGRSARPREVTASTETKTRWVLALRAEQATQRRAA